MDELVWIELDGVVNMRDLGAYSRFDGTSLRRGACLRSDNLDAVTDATVEALRDRFRVSNVVDLRTPEEFAAAPPSPIATFAQVEQMSLYPDGEFDIEDQPDDSPWANMDQTRDDWDAHHLAVARHYFGYLRLRPDSIVRALRIVAHADGAAIINCAAGKDRTGTVCAILLGALDVPDEQIVADYAASTSRIRAILDKLGIAATVGSADGDATIAAQSSPPEVMTYLLAMVRDEFGDIHHWLASQGWTDEDQQSLEAHMLEER